VQQRVFTIAENAPVARDTYRLQLTGDTAAITAPGQFVDIRLAGRSDHMLVNLFSKPGLLLQRITTREPDDSMIEVGIASVEAVFDWKAYVKEIREQA